MEIVDPAEINNPPLWVVVVEYFKEKKRSDDYYIASVLGKDQQVLFPAGWVQRDMMEGAEVRFFHAQLLAGNIKLVHAIEAPATEAAYGALIYKKPM